MEEIVAIDSINVRWFSVDEFTDVEKMYIPFLQTLDEFREYVGYPIKIHESNPEKSNVHVPDSSHYIGRAVDCSCKDVPLWDFFLAASRFPQFTGIGVYPHWNSPGLHLEMRDDVARRKYWWRNQDGLYRAITALNLRDVFIKPFETAYDT